MRYFERRGYDIKTWDAHEEEGPTDLQDCINQELVVVSSRDQELLTMAEGMAPGRVINLQE